MGVMLSAAGSLQWYRDTLAPGTSFDELLSEAECIPAGSEGLQFLPYLSGERTPHPDPLARGAFIGLTLRHSRGHMTAGRAGRGCLRPQGQLHPDPECRVGRNSTGARFRWGNKERIMAPDLASMFEAELATVNVVEGAAYGAGLLAGVGAGIWPDVATACKEVVRLAVITRPDEGQVGIYRIMYPLYRELYPALKPTFQKIE